MPADYVDLSAWQLAAAAALVLVNGAISIALRLDLERRLLVASVRTVVQLLLLGLVLKAVFDLGHWAWVLLVAAAMTLVAGVAAVNRTEHRYAGIWWNGIVSVWASSWIVTATALIVVTGVEPWYRPQYAIPLLGMILGNALNGISLGIDRLLTALVTRRDEVETLLALGGTRWEAARGPVREAIRTGMIPILNSMNVVGLVSIPGMMTGQLLAGADPVHAVEYQIAIMFLIAAATALGTCGVVLLGYRALFDGHHRFAVQRIRPSKGGRP